MILKTGSLSVTFAVRCDKIICTTVALMLVMNNCKCEFSIVIIVHYVETEQVKKSASK